MFYNKKLSTMMVVNVEAIAAISHQYIEEVLYVLVMNAIDHNIVNHSGKIIHAIW